MDLTTFRSVFLSLVWAQAALAYVEPPTNVTLDCHNMNNVLKWSYGQRSPGLRFKVHICSKEPRDGYPKDIWVNPSAQLQADVSSLTDVKSAYLLDVTAVIGQNESDYAPSDGISFTYFGDSPAKKKCNMEFPSVNVTALHNGAVLFRFTHPSLVYLQKFSTSPDTKPRKKKSHLPEFRYDVVIINEDYHHSYNCVKSVCEGHFDMDQHKKHCLKMNGAVEQISVQATQEYCFLPPKEPLSDHVDHSVIIVVCSVLAACLVFGFVFYMGYRKFTTPTTTLPKSVMFPNKLLQVMSGVVQERLSVPEVEPTSPTPLLLAEEEQTFVPRSTEPELRLRLGVSTEDQGVSTEDQGVSTEDQGVSGNVGVRINDAPAYMGGSELEEDEVLYLGEVPTGYEKRPVLDKLAPDEVTVGYRG